MTSTMRRCAVNRRLGYQPKPDEIWPRGPLAPRVDAGLGTNLLVEPAPIGTHLSSSGDGRTEGDGRGAARTPASLPPDPEAYDSPRAVQARARGLFAPYIVGGHDPHLADARREGAPVPPDPDRDGRRDRARRVRPRLHPVPAGPEMGHADAVLPSAATVSGRGGYLASRDSLPEAWETGHARPSNRCGT